MPEPRIFFMMADGAWAHPNPVLLGAIERMRALGAEVQVGIGRASVPVDFDLYILKSKSLYWLEAAEALMNNGGRQVRFLDSSAARRLCMDKAALYERLQDEGIPVPAVLGVSTAPELRQTLKDRALILKPRCGGRGEGIQVLHRGAELPDKITLSSETIVQEYMEHEAEDVKVYVIGDELHAVRKEFQTDSFLKPGRPWTLDQATRDLVLECGRACEVSLYGVDIILTPEGPMVVDLNWFPSYRAVPNACEALAGYILREARMSRFPF